LFNLLLNDRISFTKAETLGPQLFADCANFFGFVWWDMCML